MKEKIGHRPYGSGATTITIRRRKDTNAITPNPGYILLIGRRLWQDIGMPERVYLSGAEGKYLLEASDADESYRVVGPAQNTMPRCSVGRPVIESLGLTEGKYQAISYPLRHQIVFWSIDP